MASNPILLFQQDWFLIVLSLNVIEKYAETPD